MDWIDLPQLVVFPLIFAVFWGLPVAAAIWAIVTLQQIRSAQHAVQAKLDAIERLLQRT